VYVFFFKQKTAYEITYGDWSSDVCSSDLAKQVDHLQQAVGPPGNVLRSAPGNVHPAMRCPRRSCCWAGNVLRSAPGNVHCVRSRH